ncbi:MAG: type II toxin-antitoxin system RelE/ParE family toxin [Terriglobia bacterium]
MVVEFLAPAQAELAQAIAYYDRQEEGLGSRFAEEVNRAIQRILQYPEAWSPLSARTRRCRTNKFPYGVIYQIRDDTVFIVAVMHLHRKPGTWKNRLQGQS